jgi:hypothetical protein
MKATNVMRRWRAAALLATGILTGALLFATPASAHVGGTIAHLVSHLDDYFFTKSQSNDRFANVVAGTDKAKDADKLDGMDSASFAQGPGRVIGDSLWLNMTADGSPYEGSVLSIPGVGDVRYKCTFGGGLQFAFRNGSTWFQEVLEDQGGQADPTRIDLNVPGTGTWTTPLTPAKDNDLVTWFIVNSGSNEWTTNVTVGGMRFGNNICYTWAEAVVAPPATP